MPEPRRIERGSIPAALERALRYRLLNEAEEAESICRDILAIDPDNHDARITLLLSLTDQFDRQSKGSLDAAVRMAEALDQPYEREYYHGLVYERWGKSQLTSGMPADLATGWLHRAMQHYDRARQLSKPDNPDAILRWNACARTLNRLDHGDSSGASISHDHSGHFSDDVPLR